MDEYLNIHPFILFWGIDIGGGGSVREVLEERIASTKDLSFFKKKTYLLKSIQDVFVYELKKEVKDIGISFDQDLQRLRLDKDIEEYVDEEIRSNILELELNVYTIIVNFQRITGVKVKYNGDDVTEEASLLRKAQISFLLGANTSTVYGKLLMYLETELKRELYLLRRDLGVLLNHLDYERGNFQNSKDIVDDFSLKFFKVNTDLILLIENINNNIDNVFENISFNKSLNINLNFLLISAFLSVILFFPEFNNMLNLRNDELSFQDKMDEVIYEKVVDSVDAKTLIDIKYNKMDRNIIDGVDDELVKKIIQEDMEAENQRLNKEKNRIKIFTVLLSVILIPFIIWTIFIAI